MPQVQPPRRGRLRGAIPAHGQGAAPAAGDEVPRAGARALGAERGGGGEVGLVVGAAERLLDQQRAVLQQVVTELAAGEGEGVQGVEVEGGGQEGYDAFFFSADEKC